MFIKFRSSNIIYSKERVTERERERQTDRQRERKRERVFEKERKDQEIHVYV